MLSHTDLRKGVRFVLESQPYEVLEGQLVFKGRGSSVMQTKLKHLITGNTLAKTFHPADNFEEIEIEKKDIKFIYENRGKFVFCEKDNPSNRFELEEAVIGKQAKFLKQNSIVEGVVFNDKIININIPIKIQVKVIEAFPGIKGDRASSGNKPVKIETGAMINVPLFIEQDDIIEINTESGEYVKRIEK